VRAIGPSFHEVAEVVESLKKPVVAAISGLALGGELRMSTYLWADK
jgi:enoyl-CoA hydratase/carnithine racemase